MRITRQPKHTLGSRNNAALSTAIHPRVRGEIPCYAPSMPALVFAWLALCALCAWGIVYFGLGLLAELFAPEDPDD